MYEDSLIIISAILKILNLQAPWEPLGGDKLILPEGIQREFPEKMASEMSPE